MSLFTPRENPLAPALAEARRTIESQAETIKHLREEKRDLLERYHALKLQGAVGEPAIMAPHLTVPPPRESDELKALIDERAGSNYRLRAIMLRQLTLDRADGIEADEIRRRIEQGVQSDGVPA